MKITQDVREYAAQKGIDEEAALGVGMKEKAEELVAWRDLSVGSNGRYSKVLSSVKIFDQRESRYFESLCGEKILAIRQAHDSRKSEIERKVTAPNKFSQYQHEQTQYAKELVDVRVQAFMETCQKLKKYPDDTDVREFYDELCEIAVRASTNIPRIYRSALSEVPADLLKRCDEQSDNEMRQYVGIALAPVYRLLHEGQLSSVSGPHVHPQDQTNPNGEHLAALKTYIGKEVAALSDLDWDTTKAFLDTLPEEMVRVDFLKALARLPNDGLVDGYVANPQVHNRNRTFLKSLGDECSKLLRQRFDLSLVLERADAIEDHGQAIAYLWNEKREFTRYHPSIRSGSYMPEEYSFCTAIDSEIQRRKDLQSTSLKEPTMAGNTFNLTGPHSRVNIHSPDQSTNVMVERTENVFVELRQAVQSGVEPQDIRAQILSALVDLEQAKGTNNFLQKYQTFIASAANHMTLIAPFIPALTQMLGAG